MPLEWQDTRPPEPEARATYAIAVRFEPAMRAAISRAFRTLMNPTVLGEIRRALVIDGSLSSVMAVIPFYDPHRPRQEPWPIIRRDLSNIIRRTYMAAALDAAKRLIDKAGGERHLHKRDVVREAATQIYIDETVGSLIVLISNSQQEAVQRIVAAGTAAGINPLTTARQIKTTVGLLPRETKAVENRRALLASEGLSGVKLERAAERYAKKLHRLRAERIARTEMLDAQSAGRLNSWQTLQRDGFLPPNARRRWIAEGGSARTCPICLELDGQDIPLNGSYGIVDRPPAHVMCRCSETVYVPRRSGSVNVVTGL